MSIKSIHNRGLISSVVLVLGLNQGKKLFKIFWECFLFAIGTGPVTGAGGSDMLDANVLRDWQRYLFYNFMNRWGIQKPEELDGRGPNNQAPNQKGVTISHAWQA